MAGTVTETKGSRLGASCNVLRGPSGPPRLTVSGALVRRPLASLSDGGSLQRDMIAYAPWMTTSKI